MMTAIPMLFVCQETSNGNHHDNYNHYYDHCYGSTININDYDDCYGSTTDENPNSDYCDYVGGYNYVHNK